MEYTDPHHKRTEFSAESFATAAEGSEVRISFTGQGCHASVSVVGKNADVVAAVPESKLRFVLRKIQVLESLKWLTLDFEANSELSRIVAHIDQLDMDRLDVAIRSMIGQRSVLYFRH